MNPNDIMGQIEAAWSLLEKGELPQAREISEKLARILQMRLEEDEHNASLLQLLVGACHVAGFTVGLSVRSTHALVAASYFGEMLRAARQLRDVSSCGIALAYRGECFRRYGNVKTALRYLGMAYRASADQAIHGMSALLLARLSSSLGEKEQFQQLMLETEQIASNLEESSQSSLHGHYSLGTVFLEYGTHYSTSGEESRAWDCFAQAEQSLPNTPYWKTLLTAKRGLLLVHTGRLDDGMPLVVSAVKLINEQGNCELVEQFYDLQRFLGGRSLAYNRAEVQLGEALHGRL